MFKTLLPFLALLAQTAQDDPAAAAQQLSLPALAIDDLPRWRAHLRPITEELAYGEISWIPEFAAGVRCADEQGKPLLFWAMNGHPLACT